jgi:hypothetical protein
MCRICGVTSEAQTAEDFKKLLDCNNCLVDIECQGQWTGEGWESLKSLNQHLGYGFVATILKKVLHESVTTDILKALQEARRLSC